MNIVGDYQSDKSYYQKLAKFVKDCSLGDAVNFLGKVSDGELRHQYETNDIFVFPNHMQTWGLVVFEAMASGLPVIVSKTTGAAEVLENGETAILVNAKSPDEIADAIRQLVDDANFYSKFSQNGRKFVEENISWSKYTQGMLAAFEAAQKLI